jgi:hypothetical protein
MLLPLKLAEANCGNGLDLDKELQMEMSLLKNFIGFYYIMVLSKNKFRTKKIENYLEKLNLDSF